MYRKFDVTGNLFFFCIVHFSMKLKHRAHAANIGRVASQGVVVMTELHVVVVGSK
jgi:hypothetical protein